MKAAHSLKRMGGLMCTDPRIQMTKNTAVSETEGAENMAREYMPKYIRHEVWKRITSVIRDYNQLKAEYNALTEQSANLRKNELQRKLCAFEKAFDAADDETRELIRQRFWKQRVYRDIMVPMSESTMKRYVRKFVLDVGRNLGEI